LPFPEIAVSVVCISGVCHANGTKGSNKGVIVGKTKEGWSIL